MDGIKALKMATAARIKAKIIQDSQKKFANQHNKNSKFIISALSDPFCLFAIYGAPTPLAVNFILSLEARVCGIRENIYAKNVSLHYAHWYKFFLYILVDDVKARSSRRGDFRASTSMQYFFLEWKLLFLSSSFLSHFPTLEHSVLVFVSLWIALDWWRHDEHEDTVKVTVTSQFIQHVLSFHDFQLLAFFDLWNFNFCLFDERTVASF